MIEAYKEVNALDNGDVIFAAKNLKRQNYYFHNLIGLQSQL